MKDTFNCMRERVPNGTPILNNAHTALHAPDSIMRYRFNYRHSSAVPILYMVSWHGLNNKQYFHYRLCRDTL